MSFLTLSIAVGLVISLLFSEFLGIAAGGMIVPGYVAIYLDKPLTVVMTLLVSLLTYFTVKVLGSVMIVYGKRRTVLMILIGFFFGYVFRAVSFSSLQFLNVEISVIGYIIPGLIAIWFDRQGIIATCSTLITSSVIVRFVLLIVTKGDLSL